MGHTGKEEGVAVGNIYHRAMLITVMRLEDAIAVRMQLKRIELPSTLQFFEGRHDIQTICVLPWGVKCDSAEEQAHVDKLAQLRTWLAAQRFEDGSSMYEWVEVLYGRDIEGRQPEITHHEWEDA